MDGYGGFRSKGEWMVMEGSGVKTRMERGKRWFRIEV
jgi:hypothetical protein